MIDSPGWFFRPLRQLLTATSLDERRCTLCHIPFSPSHALLSALGEQHETAPSDTDSRTVPELEELPLCPACRLLLRPRLSGFCPHCGQLYALVSSPVTPCGECLASPPPWRHFRFYGPYSGALRTLMMRGKFGADPSVLQLLGRMLAQVCVDLPVPDAIVPVPLHTTRLRERGFNQSLELARPLALTLDAPIEPYFLQRNQATRHQMGLSREQRRRNLSSAFTAAPAVEGKHILLIDDTFTTGTTLRRATQALLERGASVVDVAVAARTPKPSIVSDF